MCPWEQLAALLGKGKAMQDPWASVLSRSCLQAPLFQGVGWVCPAAQGSTRDIRHGTARHGTGCWGELCCGSLTPPGTGLCPSASLQPVLRGSQTRQIRWSQKGIWKLRPACVSLWIQSRSVTQLNGKWVLESLWKYEPATKYSTLTDLWGVFVFSVIILFQW